MVHKLKLLVLFLLFHSILFAQSRFEKKGDKAFLKRDFAEAILQFKNVKDKNAVINRKIAKCYYVLGNYDQSEQFFNRIKEEEKLSADLIYLSQINLAKDNFPAALLFVERAGELGGDPTEIQTSLQTIRKLIEIRKINRNLKISPIEIRLKGKCLGIGLHPEGIVCSEASNGKLKSDKSHQLIITPQDQFVFGKPITFAGKLEPETDLGAVCFTPDGLRMYYTRWYVRKGKQQMEIAIAEKQKGKWVSKESLAFCSRKYSCCYPFLSSDGKTMYFSSDMAGGYGGMDLYVSKRDGEKWTTPMNLGESINTAQNEIYPRILSNNQLWFSSDGRSGYGKLDLFFTSKNEDGSWAQVMNPGKPYNSPYSDYSILDFPNSNIQLFVSDREDNGLRDRIYKLEKEIKESINVIIRDKRTGELVKNSNIVVRKHIDNKEIIIKNKVEDDGEIYFEIPQSEFDHGILYEIAIKKSGYTDQLIEYYPSRKEKYVEVNLDGLVEESQYSFVSDLLPIDYPDKKIAFQNIHYEKDEDDFSPEAKRILDRLYRFWKEFPELGVKINAHSDSKGMEQMNLDVSLQKAKQARKYLVEKGMKASVIEVGAWGEEFLLNACFDESECSEKEHLENRRLELIFVL